jgi:hypothetical protein
MLELKIKAGRQYVDPTSLASRFGAERALTELGDMIEYLIAQVDLLAGDPDFEETDAEDAFALSPVARCFSTNAGAGCPISDAADPAYPEWHTMRGAAKGQSMPNSWNEDDEEDDPSGQCDEDGVNTSLALLSGNGPGCEISDIDHACDDKGIDSEGCCDPLPVLDWREHDQTKPILPDMSADRRIIGIYRDRIRGASYVKIASPYRGAPPVWRLAKTPLAAINANV